jgi:hypothetical protein
VIPKYENETLATIESAQTSRMIESDIERERKKSRAVGE